MVDTVLKQFADSFLDDFAKNRGYSEETDQLFSEWLTQKSAELVYEDHQNHMTAAEMGKYLKTLFDKCEDEATEKKFLAKVGKAADVEDCTRKDLKDCADKLCKKDKDECDKVIHSLEDLVGHKKDLTEAKKYKKTTEDGGWTQKHRGQVAVHKKSGKKGVVLRSAPGPENTEGRDLVVAPLVGGTRPSYRNEANWRAGTYTLTKEKIAVNPPKPIKPENDED